MGQWTPDRTVQCSEPCLSEAEARRGLRVLQMQSAHRSHRMQESSMASYQCPTGSYSVFSKLIMRMIGNGVVVSRGPGLHRPALPHSRPQASQTRARHAIRGAHMQPPAALPVQESSQAPGAASTPSAHSTPPTQSQPSESPDMHQPAPVSRWARLQQNMNVAGVALFLRILGGDQRLAVPHLSVKDIQSVDWAAIKQAGFKAVVFDKDNTLTKPFEIKVEAHLEDSLSRCKAAFGAANITLYSNSAGLEQYDPQGHEASALEAALGINVMRHKQKKPAGDAGEVAQHFGCQTHELVMVGDRYLTDVVFGNRHNMLTIRPTPLTTQGEPKGVLVARQVEEYFVGRWSNAGVRAPDHPLAPHDALAKFVLPAPAQSADDDAGPQ